MARKTIASSVTTLFLLTGVCATLFAMGSAPFRHPDVVTDVEWGSVSNWGLVLLSTLSGLLVGYVRFDRVPYIALGGVLGLVLGVLLAPIAAMQEKNHAELAVSSLVGIVGLLAFQVFVRRSRRKP